MANSENNKMNRDISSLTFNLLSEISHELKNKLGVIGTTLKDIESGYKISNECISDTLCIYDHLLLVADLVHLNQYFPKSLNTNSTLAAFDQCKILIEFLSKKFQLTTKSSTTKFENFTLKVSIGESQLDKNILLDKSNLPDDFLKFIKYPKNSIDKISALIINLFVFQENNKNLKIELIENSSGLIVSKFQAN